MLKELVRGVVGAALALGLGAGGVQAQSDNNSDMAPMGESPDVEVTPLLNTKKTAQDQYISYPVTGQPQVVMAKVTIPRGKKTPAHAHPAPLIVHILQGKLKVSYYGGDTNTFTAGSAAVEALKRCHSGQAIGDKDVKLLAVFPASTERKPRVPCDTN